MQCENCKKEVSQEESLRRLRSLRKAVRMKTEYDNETYPVSFVLPVDPERFIKSGAGIWFYKTIDEWQLPAVCQGCPYNIRQRSGYWKSGWMHAPITHVCLFDAAPGSDHRRPRRAKIPNCRVGRDTIHRRMEKTIRKDEWLSALYADLGILNRKRLERFLKKTER